MEKLKITKRFLPNGENSIFYLILLFTFLLPLLFSPTNYINFFYTKTIPLFVVTIAALSLFIFKIFREGRFRLTWHPLFFAGLFLPVWYLISTIFSVNKSKSLIGLGVESDTVSTIAILFIFAFLISSFIRSKDRIFMAYLAFGSSYIILALFHILRLFFGTTFLNFGIFVETITNTLGKWNELAILSSVAILLSLISLEFLKLTRNLKIFSYIILGFSLFLLAVTNFPIIFLGAFQLSVFTLIGIFSVVFFVYFLASSYETTRKKAGEDAVDTNISLQKRRVPVASLVVLIISVLFTFAGNQIGPSIQRYFQVTSYEERPTWTWTTEAAWSSVKTKPLTGYGPNNFDISWAAHKPDSINNTAAWNIEFLNGVGFIPTSLFTTGPIGFVGWLAFIGLFLYLGAKALFMKFKDGFTHYIVISSFLIGLFLWLIAFIYVPTTAILVLTFLFTGLFFGALIQEGVIKEKVFVFENSKAKTFTSIMALVIILVGSIFWIYTLGQKFVSTIYASKGAIEYANAQNEEGLIAATQNYQRALNLSVEDAYLRAVSNIHLARASLALGNESGNPSDIQFNFRSHYQNALGAANLSIVQDPYNFQNHLTRGGVAESVIALGVADAYENAKQNYEQAKVLNPNGPVVNFLLARLEYANQDYKKAAEEFEKVVVKYPFYSNARFFLALSYNQLGRKDEALVQLQQIKLLNPENQEIDTLIGQIQGGTPAPAPAAATSTPATPRATSTATSTSQ